MILQRDSWASTTAHVSSHLHEEAVAVGSRRSMEQRDIFDLDPLAEWRVLRGHGAMFLYDSSEMVKACIRGRLVDPDNRLHIADFLHPDLGHYDCWVILWTTTWLC